MALKSTVAAPETSSLPLRPSAAIGEQPELPSAPRQQLGPTTDEAGSRPSQGPASLTTNGAASASSAPAASLNLHQRLAAIASEVKVQATGNTGRAAGNQRAISIGDVDEAIGPLFIKHGVLSDYEFKGEPKSFRLPTKDGEMTMWLVTIQAHIYNVENADDSMRRTLSDIGSNPSAAVSFALKRWMRALFKLVEDDDQPENHANGSPTIRPSAQSKMSTAEQARIIRLNAELPRPRMQVAMEAMLRDLPYDKALAQLSMEHERQCGANCAHVTGEV